MALESDTCQLRTTVGELIARGFVREHGDDALVIDAQTLGGTWLHEGDEAMVEVFNPDRGALTYRGVVEFAAAGRVRLRDLRLQVVRQERSALRVPTDLRVPVTHHLVDGEEVELDPPWTALVADLSAHGVRLVLEQDLPPRTRLRVRLPAPRGPLELLAEVVRSEEVRGGFAYGTRFVDAIERDHDTLFRWVLDLQRQLLARRSERR